MIGSVPLKAYTYQAAAGASDSRRRDFDTTSNVVSAQPETSLLFTRPLTRREVYQELLVTNEEKKIFPKAVMRKTQVVGWALPTTIGANYSRK